MKKKFQAVWNYRSFIFGSVKRDFQSKYQNSLIGVAWNVINPLAMIVVYTLIFTEIMKAKLPGVDSSFGYSIYLCVGILTWGLFTEIINRSQTMFIDNANLLKKISFPRLCLPVIVTVNALLNFTIVFSLFTIFLVISGNFPGFVYLAMVPLVGLLIAFAAGIGVVLGILNVFFRDVGQFFGIFVTFWFWLTPIVYLPSILPDKIRGLMALNPMASVMVAVQGIVVQGVWPQSSSLIYPFALTVALCMLGLHLFRSHSGEIVDEL
ncbi:ABC transporter permease [Microvirgula aerodenitrificans]|uniref:ABC transporter permease n=1 Tax=Microvirgula aerodenitrificans TaxID=57480 RepID=UPI0028ED8D3E|nr:ABC transporter permease [Microvirgula aerodenitrificans]